MTTATIPDVRDLRATVAGAVFAPGDADWDAARQAWNLAVDQQPAAVAYCADEDDVASVVRLAREAGLRVAPQGTGHNAGPLGSLEHTVLLRTSSMRGVEVNPVRRRARVRAGDLWQDVVGPVGAHGLTALSGSSPDVGVVGYSLGGGISWLARRHGLQANNILAVELITSEGELVRADRDREPDLFWALRGGGGNFGVVTALEFALHPIAEAHAGALVWDWEEAGPVLRRWAEWCETAPDEITTSARILQMPPAPEVPEPLRGRQIVMIDGAYTGDRGGADAALAGLRELRPELDMFATMPTAALVQLHGDPEEPTPAASDHSMIGVLPDDAVDAFVAAAGPGSGSLLMMAELRQLGGALARVPAEHGALPTLDAAFALFGLGLAADPESEAAVRADAARLVAAMTPWANGRTYLNFAEDAVDTTSAYGEDAYARLGRIRAQVDPQGVFHANHPV
ncbi:MAG: FAD-binding oxidoreductase [Solirubrobacterales bacterium]|nr:FAD-binding oxidoreductase [Solirubrobacterales bacterium]